MVVLRPVRLPDDRASLRALDCSFTTDRVYRIVQTPHSFTLEATPVQPPCSKAFRLADDLDDNHVWEHGIVAEDAGVVVGFAAMTHRRWNRRTELWHLYVARHLRGQGIGRALVEAVATAAHRAGMRRLWLETSNLAYPAIQFYRHMGFTCCGLDISLYDPDSDAAGETALYFARPVPYAPARSEYRTDDHSGRSS